MPHHLAEKTSSATVASRANFSFCSNINEAEWINGLIRHANSPFLRFFKSEEHRWQVFIGSDSIKQYKDVWALAL